MRRRRKPKLTQRVLYALARTVLFVVARLPERVGYGATAALANLFMFVSPSRMRLGLANLELAFPRASSSLTERQRRRMVRGGVVSAFQNVIDLEYATRLMRKGRMLERIDTSQLSAMVPTGGFFGLTLHLGSWEVAAAVIASVRHQVHVVGRLPRNPLMADYLRRQREAFGVLVHERRGAMRHIARALHAGGAVLHATDQNQRLRGVFAPYFGRMASSERGPATLAVRRGYPIRLGVCVRRGSRFRFELVVGAPIEVARTGDLAVDVRATVAHIHAVAENLVRRHPEQYLWVHDRYRTRPPDERATPSGS
ncbi:MAG: lysophospholipid acyltransferase family protein [Planctomycetota bacterium]